MGQENTIHIFRHCSKAKAIWREILLPDELNKFNAISDDTWIKKNLQGNFKSCLNTDACWLAIFTAGIWVLLKSRNSSVFRGKPERKNQMLFLIKQQSGDLQLKIDLLSNFFKNQNWSKPPITWKKLNIDGSVRPQENKGTIGCVLRDDNGKWVWGYTSSLRQLTGNEAELSGLLKGLQLAWEQRIPKLQVEMGSEMIFDWITEKEPPPADLIDSVENCKALLRNPWEISVKKIDRKTNGCADYLAKLG